MRRLLVIVGLALAMLIASTPAAQAHQPVRLTAANPTPDRGPLLVDGTVSFAVYATVQGKDTRGFRIGLRDGQRLKAQLLIVDTAPGNALAASALPQVIITDPRGRRTVLTPKERTPFVESFTGTRYLYLARLDTTGIDGTYSVLIRSRSPQRVETVVGVGYREVSGRVVR